MFFFDMTLLHRHRVLLRPIDSHRHATCAGGYLGRLHRIFCNHFALRNWEHARAAALEIARIQYGGAPTTAASSARPAPPIVECAPRLAGDLGEAPDILLCLFTILNSPVIDADPLADALLPTSAHLGWLAISLYSEIRARFPAAALRWPELEPARVSSAQLNLLIECLRHAGALPAAIDELAAALTTHPDPAALQTAEEASIHAILPSWDTLVRSVAAVATSDPLLVAHTIMTLESVAAPLAHLVATRLAASLIDTARTLLKLTDAAAFLSTLLALTWGRSADRIGLVEQIGALVSESLPLLQRSLMSPYDLQSILLASSVGQHIAAKLAPMLLAASAASMKHLATVTLAGLQMPAALSAAIEVATTALGPASASTNAAPAAFVHSAPSSSSAGADALLSTAPVAAERPRLATPSADLASSSAALSGGALWRQILIWCLQRRLQPVEFVLEVGFALIAQDAMAELNRLFTLAPVRRLGPLMFFLAWETVGDDESRILRIAEALLPANRRKMTPFSGPGGEVDSSGLMALARQVAIHARVIRWCREQCDRARRQSDSHVVSAPSSSVATLPNDGDSVSARALFVELEHDSALRVLHRHVNLSTVSKRDVAALIADLVRDRMPGAEADAATFSMFTVLQTYLDAFLLLCDKPLDLDTTVGSSAVDLGASGSGTTAPAGGAVPEANVRDPRELMNKAHEEVVRLPLSDALCVLEDLFSLLFASAPSDQVGESPRYIATPAAVEAVVDEVHRTLSRLQAINLFSADMQARKDILTAHCNEARLRLHLVKQQDADARLMSGSHGAQLGQSDGSSRVVSSSSRMELERMLTGEGSDRQFISEMLSDPRTLLDMCIRSRSYGVASEIIRSFKLDTALEREVAIAEAMDRLVHETGRDSGEHTGQSNVHLDTTDSARGGVFGSTMSSADGTALAMSENADGSRNIGDEHVDSGTWGTASPAGVAASSSTSAGALLYADGSVNQLQRLLDAGGRDIALDLAACSIHSAHDVDRVLASSSAGVQRTDGLQTREQAAASGDAETTSKSVDDLQTLLETLRRACSAIAPVGLLSGFDMLYGTVSISHPVETVQVWKQKELAQAQLSSEMYSGSPVSSEVVERLALAHGSGVAVDFVQHLRTMSQVVSAGKLQDVLKRTPREHVYTQVFQEHNLEVAERLADSCGFDLVEFIAESFVPRMLASIPGPSSAEDPATRVPVLMSAWRPQLGPDGRYAATTAASVDRNGVRETAGTPQLHTNVVTFLRNRAPVVAALASLAQSFDSVAALMEAVKPLPALGHFLEQFVSALSPADAGSKASVDTSASPGRREELNTIALQKALQSLLQNPLVFAGSTAGEYARFVGELVENLRRDGKILAALHLAERALPSGPPDALLLQLIDRVPLAEQWQYVMRLRDVDEMMKRTLQARNAWPVERLVELLQMCAGMHASTREASSGGPTRMADGTNTVHGRNRAAIEEMAMFVDVLRACPGVFANLQQVEDLSRNDGPKLVEYILSESGNFDLARRVATLCDRGAGGSCSLLLAKRMMQQSLNARDLLSAQRVLEELRTDASRAAVVESVVQQLPEMESSLPVLQFLLTSAGGFLSKKDAEALRAMELGLRALEFIPAELLGDFRRLHAQPKLIIEQLIMNGVFDVARNLIRAMPEIVDQDMVRKYARKAVEHRSTKAGAFMRTNPAEANSSGAALSGEARMQMLMSTLPSPGRAGAGLRRSSSDFAGRSISGPGAFSPPSGANARASVGEGQVRTVPLPGAGASANTAHVEVAALVPTLCPESKWIADELADRCMCCKQVEFGFFSRRHHCRVCGMVVCGECSMQTLVVPGVDEPVRCCRTCHDKFTRRVSSGETSPGRPLSMTGGTGGEPGTPIGRGARASVASGGGTAGGLARASTVLVDHSRGARDSVDATPNSRRYLTNVGGAGRGHAEEDDEEDSYTSDNEEGDAGQFGDAEETVGGLRARNRALGVVDEGEEEAGADGGVAAGMSFGTLAALRERGGELQWKLKGLTAFDDKVRRRFRYPRSLSATVCVSVLDLLPDARESGVELLRICEEMSKTLSVGAGDVVGFQLISVIQRLCLSAKTRLTEAGESDGVVRCDTLLGRIGLMRSLLQGGGHSSVSVAELADEQKARALRDRLLAEDRLELAQEVSTKCRLDVTKVSAAWGLSLLRMGMYAEAKEKLKLCFVPRNKSGALGRGAAMSDMDGLLARVVETIETHPTPAQEGAKQLASSVAAYANVRVCLCLCVCVCVCLCV
jgi:hypothetical protein